MIKKFKHWWIKKKIKRDFPNYSKDLANVQSIHIDIDLDRVINHWEFTLEQIANLDILSYEEYEEKYGKGAERDPYVLAREAVEFIEKNDE